MSQESNGVPPSGSVSTIFALIHDEEFVFAQLFADVPVGQMSFEDGYQVARLFPQSAGAVYAGLPLPSWGEPVNHEYWKCDVNARPPTWVKSCRLAGTAS